MSTNISLTPELEQYAKNQVASGLYRSISEFMREAVRLHRQKNLEHSLYLRDMHKELDTGSAEIDRGEISPLDMKEITDRVLKESGNG